MSEPDAKRMDALLREALSAPLPTVSSNVDQRLAKRLRPKSLSFKARIVLAVYALVALVVSVWALRPVPLAWLPWISATLLPLSFLWAIRRFRLFSW